MGGPINPNNILSLWLSVVLEENEKEVNPSSLFFSISCLECLTSLEISNFVNELIKQELILPVFINTRKHIASEASCEHGKVGSVH